ncbi:MAG: hypothetical protein OXB89_07125 [Anaerolineaceae bacterium]|nr:hypothetical protein [Anaerolineaceae bacterium]
MNKSPTPEHETEVWLREQALKDAQNEQRRLLRLISQRVDRAAGHIARSEVDPGKLNAKLSAYLRHVALHVNDLEKVAAQVARDNARNLDSLYPNNLLERTLDKMNGEYEFSDAEIERILRAMPENDGRPDEAEA